MSLNITTNLDQLDESDEESPGVRPVHYQALQQDPRDLGRTRISSLPGCQFLLYYITLSSVLPRYVHNTAER